MTNKEAIEILTQTQIYWDRRNGKTQFTKALIKAIAALIEKEEREQKAKELKELHRNKCRDCEHFIYGYGGLCSTLGSCEIRDAAFTENRRANNRACKQFKKLGPCGAALRNEEA